MRPSLFSSAFLTGVAIPLLVSSLSIPSKYSQLSSEELDQEDNSHIKFELDKPPITPAFSEETQDKHLRFDYPRRGWKSMSWPDSYMPNKCIEEAQFNNLYPFDFEVKDVWYSDCGVPWTICRHKDVKESWRSILDTFSAVPVGMRQYVANVVILPGAIDADNNANLKAAAYTRGSVLVFSPTYFKLGVLFHEITHIMDMVALASFLDSQGYPEGTPFSRTKFWKYAYGNDTAVPTPYSRVSWQEDFADAGRWAMSHVSRYRGLREYSRGWQACRTQIEAFSWWMMGLVFPNKGICTGKMEGGPAVKIVVAQKVQLAIQITEDQERPETKVEGSGVAPIVMPAGTENMFFVYHGAV